MNNIDKFDENLWWFKRTYNQLVERARSRGLNKSVLIGYYEKHHILPKCMGGSDDKENLVLLTYREHIICHILLVRIHPGNDDLIRAADFMLNVDREDENGNKIVIKLKNTKIAVEIKMRAVELNTGENHPLYGTHITEEHKRILSEVNSRKRDLQTRINMSNAWLGTRHTPESKEKMRKAKLGKKLPRDPNKWYGPRKVIDRDGILHLTIRSAAEKYGVSPSAIKGWIRRNQGFSYAEDYSKKKIN